MGKPHFVVEPVITSSEALFWQELERELSVLAVPCVYVLVFVHVCALADVCVCDGVLRQRWQLWCLCPLPTGCVGVPCSPVGLGGAPVGGN